jgi:aldehyde dehydrogenase (NAD+)
MTAQTIVESRSPQRPSDIVASEPAADRATVEKAVATARQAAQRWAGTPALARSQALNAAADALAGASERVADLAMREVGKPIGEATGEVARGVAILRYYAQQALDANGETYPASDGRSLLMTRRFPLGVAGLITPWNFPIAIPLWKAAPALAFGNGVVLKPSPDATGCASAIAEAFAGRLPDGLFHVVHGGAETGSALVDAVDGVSFTGSVTVGHQVAVAAANNGIPAQAEMGGQNASIVLPDADLHIAATTIAAAAMGYAGQKCTATSRAVVVGDPRPFTEAYVEAVSNLQVGDPADAGTVVGPVITERARDRITSAIAQARDEGGTIATGGELPDRHGWFVTPTVVTGLTPDAMLARTEVFGPITAVLSARDVDDAVAITNGVDYGLVTAVFTRDLDRALDLLGRIDTGLLKVNGPTSGVDFHTPFGGEKASSIGPREQGKAAREFYTTSHTIQLSPHTSP